MNQALEEKLGSNEARLERMRQTIEGGLQKINEDNRQQLEQMRQTVDEKLQRTLENRLNQSFQVVGEGDSQPECRTESCRQR